MKSGCPSHTAVVVAKSVVLTASLPETCGLVDSLARTFAQRALHCSGHRRFAPALQHAWLRGLVQTHESLMIPGLALHHALRKHAIGEFARRGLLGGAAQLVQVGAGFDSLAFRLHREFPKVRFVEVDHPATQSVKREVIDSLGGAGENFELYPADLTRVDGAGWTGILDPERPCLVIMEGVLMYLDPCRVGQVLRSVGDALAPKSRLMFSFMTGPAFRRQSPAVGWWLRWAGEPFRWWLPEGGVDAFLHEAGLSRRMVRSTRSVATNLELQGPCGRPLPTIAEGELLCEASPSTATSSAMRASHNPAPRLVGTIG